MRWNKSAGTTDLELAYSRGGRCWRRAAPNRPILAMDGPKTWDGVQVYPSSTLVCLDDEIRLYYSGMPIGHDEDYSTARSCIGVASWRVDGFVSLDAGGSKGELLTRPFALRAPEIFVNADARGGHIRAHIGARKHTQIIIFGLKTQKLAIFTLFPATWPYKNGKFQS